MLKIFLILILMMMLVWILFQYWNQLVCNTLFTSKIIRKCFLELVHFFQLYLQFLELRMNPLYSIYFNWFRFIVIGIIPFALLVSYFFSSLHQKIYFTKNLYKPSTYYTKDFAKCTLFFCEKPKIQKMIYTKMFLDFLKYFLH